MLRINKQELNKMKKKKSNIKHKKVTCNRYGKEKSIILFIHASSRATSGRIKS